MIGARERNGRRLRAVRMARAFKAVFQPMAVRDARARMAGAVLLLIAWLTGGGQAWRRWIYRIVFTEGDTRRMAARAVLADLRDFTFAQSSAFDRDPIIMARREGRRDVWLRITQYLNLDEEQVQKLMEIDDGI